MPNYSRLIAGSQVTWKPSGGTKVLTFTSLASAAARQGDKSGTLVDGTYGRPQYLEFRLESAVAVAAATGATIDLFLGESDNATAASDNPGNLTGADGSWATPAELFSQLRYVGSLVLSATQATSVQKVRLIYPSPLCAYICPVIFNQSGQALHGTAGNHQLVMTPYYREIG